MAVSNKKIVHMIQRKNQRFCVCGQKVSTIRYHTNYEEVVTCPLCIQILNDDEKTTLKTVLNKKIYNKDEVRDYLCPIV